MAGMGQLEGLNDAIRLAGVDMADMVAAAGALRPEDLDAWHAVHGALFPEFAVDPHDVPNLVRDLLNESTTAAGTLAMLARLFVKERLGEEAAVELMQVLRSGKPSRD